MKKEEVSEEEGRRLEEVGVEKGTVKEFSEMKDFGAFLGRDHELVRWWRANMGFVKDGDL